MKLTTPYDAGPETFLYSDRCTDLDSMQVDIAYLGIPFGQAYSFAEISNDQSTMPRAMRLATTRILRSLDRYDFDLDGTLYNGQAIRAVDCGDVIADPLDHRGHSARAEAVVRKILATGALPIILGGDHGIPIPVLRAMDGLRPVTLVQIDQHIDWRDEVNGVREGLSSPMRRASEMDHIGEIFQIGLHASGSARQEEVDAARAYGAHLISAYEVHDHGMDAVLAKIPDRGNYYLTVDLDGIDPAIAPGVGAPSPGGLTFTEARRLVRGLVGKGRVVGMDVVEITPSSDVNDLTAITAGRLIVNLVGAAVRAGYFERGANGR